MRHHLVTLLVALGSLVPRAMPDAQDRPTLTLASRLASTHPGSVMLLGVRSAQSLTSVEGTAFKRSLRFWATADPKVWQALVGVPLDTSPGSYAVTAQAREAGGHTAEARLTLTIGAAKFETRRLQVDPRFVNPPAEESERIAREARTLAMIFARATPERLWHEPFMAPVPGQATSSFGRLTILNGLSRGRHLGADFRAAEGTPVVAPNAGRVVLTDDYYFSGTTVVIDHGAGLYSLLGHLSRRQIKTGADVRRGDAIGESGATGRVTGPHLHWAVRLQNDSVDPLALLEASRVADTAESNREQSGLARR